MERVERKLWSKRVAYGLVLKYVFETRCRSYTPDFKMSYKMQVRLIHGEMREEGAR